eukprot:1159019-Pelagomonas_calceolata.AAC.1
MKKLGKWEMGNGKNGRLEEIGVRGAVPSRTSSGVCKACVCVALASHHNSPEGVNWPTLQYLLLLARATASNPPDPH